MPEAKRQVFGDIVAPFAVSRAAVAHKATQKKDSHKGDRLESKQQHPHPGCLEVRFW